MSNPQYPNQGGQQQPGGYPPPGGYQQPPNGYQQPGMQQPYGYGGPAVGYAPAPAGPLGMPKASFGQRFVSWLIDGIIVGFLAGIPFMIFVAGAIGVAAGSATVDAYGNATVSDAAAGGAVGLVLLGVMIMIVLPAAYIIFMVAKGQTLGNKVAGMRFLTPEGNAPGFGRSFVRFIVQYLISGIFFIGYLWMFWDPQQQTLHDKLSGIFGVSSPR